MPKAIREMKIEKDRFHKLEVVRYEDSWELGIFSGYEYCPLRLTDEDIRDLVTFFYGYEAR
jgi:hypothetical protein